MTTDIATLDDIEVSERIERIIWKGLGNKSIRQIAQETGLEPERVLRIKNQMFESIDDLTLLQKKQKLIVELEAIAYDARERAESSIQDFQAGLYNSAIAALKAMMVELNRLEKADNSKIEALNSMRIKELLRLIDVTVAKTFSEISERHGIDGDELFDIFQSHLRPAAEELDI